MSRPAPTRDRAQADGARRRPPQPQAASAARLRRVAELDGGAALPAELAQSAAALRPRDLTRVRAAARERRRAIDAVPPTDVGLALLAAVGERVADEDDRNGYLSFPALAPAIDPDHTFSMVDLVSMVPDGGIIWRPFGRQLWDMWEVVLGAEVADVEPDAEAVARRDAARGLLFEQLEPPVRTGLYESYEELQAAYIDALLEVADATADAEAGVAGAAERLEAARGVATRAEQRWATEGRRDEIDEALAVLARFGADRPQVLWDRLRRQFRDDTMWRQDADSMARYPQTSFVPRSVEQATWTSVDLDAAEMAALAETMRGRFPELAASELFSPLADAPAAGDVTRVRAEVSHLRVERPWFEPAVLGMRTWRLPEGAEPLSDGGSPPSGRLPAYTTGMVLIRGVEVELAARRRPVEEVREDPRPTRPTAPSRSSRLSDGVRVRDHRQGATSDGVRVRDHRQADVTEVRAVRGRRAVERSREQVPARRGGASSAGEERRRGEAAPAAGEGGTGVPSLLRIGALVLGGAAGGQATARLGSRAEARQVDVLLDESGGAPTRPRPVERVAARRGRSAARRDAAETDAAPAVRVMAFVCVPVPSAPDPDPTLFGRAADAGAGDAMSPEAVEAALAYNRRQGFSALELITIRRVVGLPEDGEWDEELVRAVARWQAANGIAVDGRVWRNEDGDTWSPIQAAAGASGAGAHAPAVENEEG